jgi:hypothetical protein
VDRFEVTERGDLEFDSELVLGLSGPVEGLISVSGLGGIETSHSDPPLFMRDPLWVTMNRRSRWDVGESSGARDTTCGGLDQAGPISDDSCWGWFEESDATPTAADACPKFDEVMFSEWGLYYSSEGKSMQGFIEFENKIQYQSCD